jgi:hypothetical protein
MSEGLPIRFTGAGKMGMPKHAKRVWPFEEGCQPLFWEREEELSQQYVSTSIAREIAMQECIEGMKALMPRPGELVTTSNEMQPVLDAYDIRVKEIYTAHSKAIHEIKARYPSVK